MTKIIYKYGQILNQKKDKTTKISPKTQIVATFAPNYPIRVYKNV